MEALTIAASSSSSLAPSPQSVFKSRSAGASADWCPARLVGAGGMRRPRLHLCVYKVCVIFFFKSHSYLSKENFQGQIPLAVDKFQFGALKTVVDPLIESHSVSDKPRILNEVNCRREENPPALTRPPYTIFI